MPAPKVPDHVFLETWKNLQSVTEVAKALQVDIRNVQTRRRRIEERYGIELKAKNTVWTLKEQDFIRLEIDSDRVLISSDLHVWPGVPTTALDAFVLACEYMQPAVVVLNGDVFDGSQISRFGASERNKAPSAGQELQACKEYLDQVVAAARRGRRDVQLIWVMGNHDNRYVRTLIAAAGQAFDGVMGMDLRDHFPDWKFCYRLSINEGGPGHTDVVHNWAGGIHAAYNNVLRSGVNYVTGHTHRNLTRPWRDRTGQRYGVETGTGMDIDGPQAYYVAGRPVDWHPGFPLLTFHRGRLLRPEHVDVLEEGEFSFRGQVVKTNTSSKVLASQGKVC